MKKCATCGNTILFGGRNINGKWYCNESCFNDNPNTMLDLSFLMQPIKKLKTRGCFRLTKYFHKGVLIATFDGGPCQFWFEDGRTLIFSQWNVNEDIKSTVLRRGSAELACLIDPHETVVESKEEATRSFYGFDGTTTHYKSGESEVVAHSETPFDKRAERLIVCGGKTYRAQYLNYFKVALTEYNTGAPVGLFSSMIIRSKMVFYDPLPLIQGIYIAMLISICGEKCNPYMDVGIFRSKVKLN
jgi:hypothetical protein